jgi:hypothetical protein
VKVIIFVKTFLGMVNRKKNKSVKVVKKKVVKEKKDQVKKVRSAPSIGFKYYNLVRSAVSVELKRKGIKYNRKDLGLYTSDIYRGIKDKYPLGTPLFFKALDNIDILVSQKFETQRVGEPVDKFVWFSLPEKLSYLPANTLIYIDTDELMGEFSGGNNEYIGSSFNSSRFISSLTREINNKLKRKGYFYFVEVFFRDEESKKEFFYFFMLDENDPRMSYTLEEMREYLINNVIPNIDDVFRQSGVIDKENSGLGFIQADTGYENEEVDKKVREQEVPEIKPVVSDIDKEIELEKEKQKTIEEKMKAFRELKESGMTIEQINKFLGL